MVYSDSSADREQVKTVHRLVAQVSRAFFDPPYVIILDKMVTKDMWFTRELAMQSGSQPKELVKFLAGLQRQRIIKRYTNTERNEAPRTAYQASRSVKRDYWYIDYQDLANVVKYRLAAIRQRIESSVTKETQKTDYKCLRCGREYTALDVAFLVAHLPPSSSGGSGDFTLVCEHCGAELKAKLNEEEQLKEDDKMQRFNEATEHIRRTLREVEKIKLGTFDPKRWLLKHVATTIDVEYDEKGRPIVRDPSERIEQNVQIEITTEGDEERKKAQKEKLGEAQRQQNALPVWHTHSTISGQQTSLGLAHAEREAKKAAEAIVANSGGLEKKVDLDDADLAAHYAKLEAQAENGSASAVKQEPVKREMYDDEDDDEEAEMEAAVPYTNGRSTANAAKVEDDDDMEEAVATGPVEAMQDPLVTVGGKSMRFSQVTEDMHGQMTDDEYTTYARILDDMEADG